MNVRYPLVHWLLSLLLSPVFLSLFNASAMWVDHDRIVASALELMGVILFYAGSLSVPILFLYALGFNWMRSRGVANIYVLIMGNALVIGLMALVMFYWIGGYTMPWLFGGFASAVLFSNFLLLPGFFLDRKLGLWAKP